MCKAIEKPSTAILFSLFLGSASLEWGAIKELGLFFCKCVSTDCHRWLIWPHWVNTNLVQSYLCLFVPPPNMTLHWNHPLLLSARETAVRPKSRPDWCQRKTKAVVLEFFLEIFSVIFNRLWFSCLLWDIFQMSHHHIWWLQRILFLRVIVKYVEMGKYFGNG